MTPQIKQRIEQIRRGEVPEGYKKTKAGVIPCEWDIHVLSKHLTESRISGTNGAIAKKLTVKLWNKGVFEKREVHEGSESTTYYKRKAGQLIYSKLDFLNCAFGIIPEHLDGYESTQDLPCFDMNNVDPYYLLTYVTQRNFYTHFGMIADGGRKARRVGPEDMLSFPLVYPSLYEQQKIAKILSAQDKLSALKEKLIEEKKRQKKALMQQLLTGKKRLPGFSEDWVSLRLKQVAERITRKNAIANNNVLTISAQYGLINQFEFFDKEIASEDKSNYYLLMQNEFAYNKSYSTNYPFGAIKKLTKYDMGIVSPLYICFRIVGSEISTEYMEHYFEAGLMNSEIQSFAQEGARNHGLLNISVEDFFQSKIVIPPYDEQIAIERILSSIAQEIDLLQQTLEQEKQKKKALMQLLLTGIVRV